MDLARVPPDWPNRACSRSVTVGNLQWHVQVAGSGPTVLLLHGSGSSAHSWADVLPRLSEHATVVAPDLPGHGFTSGADVSALNLPRIAEDIFRLLNALELPTPLLVAGHSAGVPLAMRLAKSHLPELKTIVGFNPALIAPPRAYTDFIAPFVTPLATSGMFASLVASLSAHTGLVGSLLNSTRSEVPTSQRERYAALFTNPAHVRGAMGFMAAADLEQVLFDARDMAAPLHFVLGTNDAWVPLRALQNVIASKLPGAFVEIWDGGHLLHEVDPQRAVSVLIGKLKPGQK